MAAIALGMVAAPVAAAAAAPRLGDRVDRPTTDPVDELITDLESALGSRHGGGRREPQSGQEAAAAGRGGSERGRARRGRAGRARAHRIRPTGRRRALRHRRGAAAAAVAEPVRGQGEPSGAPRPSPRPPKAPKAPKGGATPSQVAKAKAQAAKDKAAYEKDKAQKAKAKEAVAEAEAGPRRGPEAAATVALADLEAATTSHAEAADHAAATQSATTGLAALLPGAPTEEEVAAAALAEQAAADRLAAAVASRRGVAGGPGVRRARPWPTSRPRWRSAPPTPRRPRPSTRSPRRRPRSTRRAWPRPARLPMAKGTYRLTARFGQTGGLLVLRGPHRPGLRRSSGHRHHGRCQRHGGLHRLRGRLRQPGRHRPRRRLPDHLQPPVGHRRLGRRQGVHRRPRSAGAARPGNSTGAHLHFEVTKDGKFVDPEGWLGW